MGSCGDFQGYCLECQVATWIWMYHFLYGRNFQEETVSQKVTTKILSIRSSLPIYINQKGLTSTNCCSILSASDCFWTFFSSIIFNPWIYLEKSLWNILLTGALSTDTISWTSVGRSNASTIAVLAPIEWPITVEFLRACVEMNPSTSSAIEM